MNSREALLKSMEKHPNPRYHVIARDSDIITHKFDSFALAVTCAYRENNLVYDTTRDFWVYDGETDNLRL